MERRCLRCNAVLPPPVRKDGRQRRYCDDRCRDAAYRERQRRYEPMPQLPIAEPDGALESLLAGRRADTDTQVGVSIIESRALASTFARLAREARPPFRWRCAGMGNAIAEALSRYFEEVTDDEAGRAHRATARQQHTGGGPRV